MEIHWNTAYQHKKEFNPNQECTIHMHNIFTLTQTFSQLLAFEWLSKRKKKTKKHFDVTLTPGVALREAIHGCYLRLLPQPIVRFLKNMAYNCI